MEKALVVQNLKKNYGNLEALKGISFEVTKGEIFALIGPNGAGKTTTLRIISTILSPTSGSVTFNGLDVKRDAAKIRSIISYLPEEAGAYKNLTGISYLKFFASIFAKNKEEENTFVERASKISGLQERLKDKIGTYSKGMTRKLLISRTIMIKPELAIIDEPTSGLDVVNALEIRNTIRDLAKEGVTVLLSSHNMLEIEYLSDRVAIIDKGRIYEIGESSELKKKYSKQNLEEVFVEVIR